MATAVATFAAVRPGQAGDVTRTFQAAQLEQAEEETRAFPNWVLRGRQQFHQVSLFSPVLRTRVERGTVDQNG